MYSCSLCNDEDIEGTVIKQNAEHARTNADVLAVCRPLTTFSVSNDNLFTH